MSNTKKAPHIPMHKVVSSSIQSMGHDPLTKTMVIQFKGKGENDGSIYHYADVPVEEFEKLKGAKSIGSHFSKEIIGKFTHTIPPRAKH